MIMRRFFLPMVMLVMTLAPARWQSAAEAAIEPGVWEGAITLPTRAQLNFSIEFGFDEQNEPWARITIPDQGVADMPLSDVVIGERDIAFTIAESGAEFSGRLGVNGESIVGVLNQAGQQMPFRIAPRVEAPVQNFAPIAKEAQRWRGVARLPSVNLEFMVHFTPAPTETGWSGTIDIPLQGVSDFALKDVTLGDTIKFTIHLESPGAPPPAIFTLQRTADEAASGNFSQAGSVFFVSLKKVTDPNETVDLPRPQHPKPPYPYGEQEVTYFSPVDGVQIAGTLTIPEGDGPHPAVLMITGSGAQDRDETLMGHKPFLVIADYLTRRGVAVLRVDDRGVGGSGGDIMATTHETNVADVVAGVAFLANQPQIDPARIGLIGHSEGGWIAPMAAAQSDKVAYLVLLAAPGVSGKELLLMQRDLVRQTAGVPAEQRERERARHQALLDAIERDAPEAEIADALRQLALAERDGFEDAETYADAIVEQQLRMISSPWFRDVMNVDSRAALRQVTVPVLAITGELDRQVPPNENMPEIRGALDAAGNANVHLVVLPGLNHLLQRARTGLPGEYLMIQETISPQALELMASWIREQTGLPPLEDARAGE